MGDIRYLAWAGYDFAPCAPTTASGIGSGCIELEYGWQLASVPIQFGYWNASTHQHVHDGVTTAKFENYILDQVTDLYGTGVVEVANTYLGDNNFFWSYVVGSTPATSPHNWQLVYDDGICKEISGFWIKIIKAGSYTITWGE